MSTDDLLKKLQILTLTDSNDLPLLLPEEIPEENMPANPPTFDMKNLAIVPEYNGNPNELFEFINSTTLLLNYYWNTTDVGCFQNHMLTQGIKSKLTGRAKEIVSIYGCLDWESIKGVLIQNFADQRNENSLTRDLVNLRQMPNESPQQFHEKIMGLLNTISNYIELHHNNPDVKTSKKLFFHQQALTTFMAGLREPLGSTIRAMRPNDLAAAIQFIQEENNIRYLQKGFSITQPSGSKTNQHNQKQTFSQPFQSQQFRAQNPSQQQLWPSSPFQRAPQQQQFRSPFNQTRQPIVQPARFQAPRPQFNVWQSNPNRTLSQPTPMSTTSRTTIKPSQQPPPKFTVEELFNIEQHEETQDNYEYTNPETDNNCYDDYQQQAYEQHQYTEGENFPETADPETEP